MQNYEIYAAGEFISANNTIEVRNPYNNQLFATTYIADSEILNRCIEKAIGVQHTLLQIPVWKRNEILLQIVDGLKENIEHLAKILAIEAAKPLKYALGEINRSIATFTIAAEETKRLPREYMSLDWTAAGANKEALVKYFPVGLVAGIAPFNFPMNLAVHKLAPAIAAGCPIILKPSRSTPLSVLELAKIIDKTDLPKGAVSILPMDRKSGDLLVTDERIKMLSFTGSPAVGWDMKNRAGKKKIALELGGNAGAVVAESADIELAVNKCFIGSFAYSGQVCIHLQRTFIHETIFNEFVEKLIAKTKLMVVGEPESPDTDFSSMIDENNAVRVEEWVNEAVKDGAKILYGGKRQGTFFEPTILTHTKAEMKVCALEVFGPVVTIEPYSDFEQVIGVVNNSEYGLQAGVFTDRISEMNYAFNNLEVGGVIINDVPTFRVDQMPYGGVKNSGFGREGVKYAIHEMMEPRLLVKNVH